MKELLDEFTEKEQETITNNIYLATKIWMLTITEELESVISVLKAKNIVTDGEIELAQETIRNSIVKEALPQIKEQIEDVDNPGKAFMKRVLGNRKE